MPQEQTQFTPERVGSSDASIGIHDALVEMLGQLGEADSLPLPPKFDPRLTAEEVPLMIDELNPRGNATIDMRQIYTSGTGETWQNGPDETAKAKLNESTYVAGMLGFKIGDSFEVTDAFKMAGFKVHFPKKQELPALSTVDNEPREDLRDALYAAHYLADNEDFFRRANPKPVDIGVINAATGQRGEKYYDHLTGEEVARGTEGAMTQYFRRIVQQAEGPDHIIRIVKAQQTTEKQRCELSFARQVARVLGYGVRDFVLNKQSGTYEMTVSKPMRGYDAKHTHFPEERHWDEPVQTETTVHRYRAPVFTLRDRIVTVDPVPSDAALHEDQAA